MAYIVSLQFNTSVPAGNALAVSIWHEDEAVTGRLAQIGPVRNNVVSYRGAFASLREAAASVIDYAENPGQLVELTDNLGQGPVYRWERIDARQPFGVERRVLGRRTPAGRWLADA